MLRNWVLYIDTFVEFFINHITYIALIYTSAVSQKNFNLLKVPEIWRLLFIWELLHLLKNMYYLSLYLL